MRPHDRATGMVEARKQSTLTLVRHSLIVVAVLSLALVAGCSGGGGGESGGTGGTPEVIAPAKLQPEGLIAEAPDGSKPSDPSSVDLTPEQCDKVRAGNFKVAIAMQTMGIDWSQIQVRTIKKHLATCGVEVINVTDGRFNVEKQISDIQNTIALKPDGILSSPVDEVATGPAYAKAAEADIPLVFLDEAPRTLEYPTQYQSAVGSDNQGNGAVAAHALALNVPKNGSVGMINFAAVLFAGEQRTKGFKDWMKANRPDIEIKETTFNDVTEVSQIAADFVTANPDLKGLYGVYDAIGLEALAGVRQAGVDIPVSTIDLGEQAGVEIAKGGIVATGAQRVADQGEAEANAMMLTLIGEKTPKYIMVPTLAVTPTNVLEAYNTVYGVQEPSAPLVEACDQSGRCGN